MSGLNLDDTKMVEAFQNDVLEFLCRFENDTIRLNWKIGASLSYCKQWLRDEKHWIRLGGTFDFACSLRDAGFCLVPAKLKNGEDHKRVEIVSL